MKELLLVCIGSFFGGGARYLVSKAVQSLLAVSFPWGTMTVNVLGCFLIGLLSGLSFGGQISPTTKLVLVTGFCGGFTTFSTFMNENLIFGREGAMLSAILYTLGSLVLGLIAVVIGYQIVK
jgi:CrcB protein